MRVGNLKPHHMVRKALVLLLILFTASAVVASAEGGKRPGSYVARYEIPFSSLYLGSNMTSNGERSLEPEYHNGKLIILVTTHSRNTDECYPLFQLVDSSGERIWHDYLIENPHCRVMHITSPETIHTIGGTTSTCIERFVVDFEPIRFQFGLIRGRNGLECQVARLIKQGNQEVFTENSYSAFFPASAMETFREFFREAQQYRAVRML